MERWKVRMNSGSARGTAKADRDTYAMIMPKLNTPMTAQRTEGTSPPVDFNGAMLLAIEFRL
jgi:hypothetical protein